MSRTTDQAIDHQEAMAHFDDTRDDAWIGECMERAEFEGRVLPAVRFIRPNLTQGEIDALWAVFIH